MQSSNARKLPIAAETSKKASSIGQSMTSGFAALSVVSNACNAVQNTVLDIPKDEAKELAQLKADLKHAQNIATNWTGGIVDGNTVAGLAPAMMASIPNNVVSYGTNFNQATDDILKLIKKNGGTIDKGTEDYRTVLEAIQSMSGSLDKITKDVKAAGSSMKNWGINMQNTHNAMLKGVGDIQNVEKNLHSDIEAMNAAIAALHKEIDAENAEIIAAASAIVLGAGLIIVGVFFMPETDGVSGQLVVVGAVSIIGGSVECGMLAEKIKKQFKKIGSDQSKLAADKQLIVALQGLTVASNLVVASISRATEYLLDLETSWDGFLGNIKNVLKELHEAENGSAIDFKSLLDIDSAQAGWNEAIKEANELIGLAPKTIKKKVKTL